MLNTTELLMAANHRGLDHGTTRFFTIAIVGTSRGYAGEHRIVGIARGHDGAFSLITARDVRRPVLTWDDEAQRKALVYLREGYLV